MTAQLQVQVTGAATLSGPFQIVSAEERMSGRPVVLKVPRDVLGRDLLSGELWTVSGDWRCHARYGHQFEVVLAVPDRPDGRRIVAYLSGPRFPDIGPATAGAIWAALGEGIYDVLDRGDAVRLAEVLGPGVRSGRRIARLITGWADAGAEPQLYRWLAARRVPPRLSPRLIEIFGAETPARIGEDPFRLISFGANWLEMEAVAACLNIAPDDDRRLAAAVEHVLHEAYDRCDTAISEPDLLAGLAKLLGSMEQAKRALEKALERHLVVAGEQGFQALGPALMERVVAESLVRIHRGVDGGAHVPMACERMEASSSAGRVSGAGAVDGLILTDEQRSAVRMARRAPMSLLVGGAGVGKTSTLRAILAALDAEGREARLVALTGRAALRMTESTGRPAATIRSFLNGLKDGREHLPPGVLFVIDEASMVDLATMFELVQRLPPDVRLLLVGDDGQLPPISPGLVFHALVRDDAFPRVELRKPLRQSAGSDIPNIAQLIREGRVPDIEAFQTGSLSGVSFVECEETEIIDAIIALVGRESWHDSARIIGAFKGASGGAAGSRRPGLRAINDAFHKTAARSARGPAIFDRFHVGEPVVWLRNDYGLGLMNGELGVVEGSSSSELKPPRSGHDSPEDPCKIQAIRVRFGDKVVEITAEVACDRRRLDLAYAISTHKAQGSQADRVIVPIAWSRIMDRTMLYTAITRATRQVVLVGDRRVFARTVTAPPNHASRRTGLAAALRAARQEAG